MTDPARAQRRYPPLAVLPAMGWMLWFLLVPLCIVALYSVSKKGMYGGVVHELTFENFVRAGDPLYLRVFWNSLKLAIFTTVSCLLIGYPMAYVMATARRSLRSILLVLVVVPFWTNFVVRAYAIKLLLSESGPINALAAATGWFTGTLISSNGPLAVWLGMVTNYLPFMVLPLYVSLEKFDFSLLEAARDLGARPRDRLFKVLLPLTRPGIVSGVIFVFTPALGEFVIPDLLGGARTYLIGNLVTEQFLKARDWPFGSALSMLLIVIVLASLALYLRASTRELEAPQGGARVG